MLIRRNEVVNACAHIIRIVLETKKNTTRKKENDSKQKFHAETTLPKTM